MGNPLNRPIAKVPLKCEYEGTKCPEPGKNIWRTAGGATRVLCDPHDVEAERFVRSGEAIPARRGQ
jgi:hypothetical protein